MSEIDGRISQANGRLKAAKVGAVVEKKGDRLYIRATLPPKPSSTTHKPHQQRLALGIHANPAGLKVAEAEARKIGALLDCKQFSWKPYIKDVAAAISAQTVSDWVKQFEEDYFQRRKRSQKSETTWKGDYLKVFRQLPQAEVLTTEVIRQMICSTEPDSKTRKRACIALGALEDV